jgi:Flp pilus assembly pilin Flp
MLARLWRDESGASLLEYVGLAVLILLGVWVAAQALTGGMNQTFGNLKGKLTKTN